MYNSFSLENVNKKEGDKMYDYTKLKERIQDNNLTQEQVAKSIGISKGAFSQKINGSVAFSQDDVIKISDVLNIPKTKIYEYFFTLKV